MYAQDDTQPSAATIADQQEQFASATSRRAFLRRLAFGGGLALGAGGIAAYLVNQQRTTIVVLPNGDAVRVPPDAGSGETTGLLAQLADLRTALADSDEERRDLAGQLAEAKAEIERLNEERDGLLSLMALYEALEETGLDDIIAGGLAALSGGLALARELVALLEPGVTKGLGLLRKLTEDFPGPQAGIIWLKGEVSALLLNLETLRVRVEDAIEPIESFVELIAAFILDVLRKLPFGLGNPARGGLETMQTIVTGLPPFADGITLDVLDPLDVWFGQDNQANLLGTLVKPLEDDLITPANGTIDSFNSFDERYQNDLVTPVEAALAERETIKAQIAEQRAQLSGRLLAHLDRQAG